MTQEFDDSFMADIIDDYKELKKKAEKAPRRKISRALKRTMPNPVGDFFREQRRQALDMEAGIDV